MFSFGDKSNVIDKARRVLSKGDSSKAVDILKSALTDDESDLPLILEIMHTYLTTDKLNEVIVWAKKGENLSSDASRQVLSEMEDLYYGRGKPDQLAEYLIEKKTEKKEFEEVFNIFREMTEEGKKHFQEKEDRIIANIRADKKKFNQRDLTHLYLLSIVLEGRENKRAVEILFQIIEKNPKELERIIEELRRINQEFFGNEWLLFGLGHALLLAKHDSEGISKIRDGLDRNDELLPKALSILESFKDKSQEILNYLSELYIETGKEKEAISLIKEFENEEAIKKYQRMIKKNPKNPVLHKNLANVYLEKKRYSESLKEFLASVEIAADEEIGKKVKEIENELPLELDPHLYLSSIYKELGRAEESINELEKAFEIDPTASEEILERLNSTLKESKEFTKALSLKARLITKEGDVEQALNIFKQLAQKEDGLDIAKEGLKNLKREHPHNIEIELIHYMLRIPEEPEEAGQHVDRILSKESDYVPFMLTEYDGWIRAKPEVAPQFLHFYEVLEHKNFPPFTYPFALAELKRLTKDFENAEKFYIDALYEDPERFDFILDQLEKHKDRVEIRKIIATLYFHKGEYKKGCNEIKIALKQFPEDTSNTTSLLIKHIHSKKGNKYLYQTLTEILLNQKHYDEAIRWGEKALESIEVEKQGELLLDLSKAHAKIRNYSESAKLARKAWGIDNSLVDQAISVLEEIRENETPEPDILMTLYELYSEKEDAKKGIVCLDDVLKQKPSMADIIAGEYERLIEIVPIDASLRIHYGRAKLLMGDETGISEIEKGIRFDPKKSEEALGALEGYEDPEIANKALFVKGKILIDLGRKEEALNNFIESYWKNEDEKEKSLEYIETLFSSLELSGELIDKLFNIYYSEGRNTRLVNLIESYFDGSKERGEFLTQKIDKTFEDVAPLPLRISQAEIFYKIGEKEKAKSEMEYLLKEYPDVAEKLKDIINPEDSDMLQLLIKINLELSNWDTLSHYIKQLDVKERVHYYEQLLDKSPDNENAIKEAGYIYFLMKDWENAKLYLKSISNPSKKEELLLWWLGEDIQVNLNNIRDSRREILHDMINIAESLERRAQLYIELEEYEKAYNEIEQITGDKKEILISLIELKIGDYAISYDRLTKLKQTDEVRLLRYFATLRSRNYGLSLKLLSNIEMNPDLKKKFVSGVLKNSISEYSFIHPIIRR
jgi:tetratricopeptide (TPR) repeat protein